MAEVVRAGVQLNDGVTPVLKGMVSSVRGVIAAFDKMDKGVAKGVDVKALRKADNELLKIQNHLSMKGAAGGGGGVFGGVAGGAAGASGALGAFGKLGGAITVANQGLQLLEATAGRALGAVGDAVGSVLSMGMDRAGAIEGAESTLEGLHHSADEIDEIMEAARQSVLGTFFDLGAAGKVASSAVAAGVQPGQDLERYLTLVADAASIAKVDMSEMGGVFNKVAAGEKMTAYELNQLTDKGIPALSLLAQSMGTTSGAVRDMVSAGEIGIEELQDAIELGMGGAAKAVDTFEAGVANSEAALGRLGAGFLAPLRDAGKEVLAEVIPMIDELTETLTPVFDTVANVLAPAMDILTSSIDVDMLGQVIGQIAVFWATTAADAMQYAPPLFDLALTLLDIFNQMMAPLLEDKESMMILAEVAGTVLYAAFVALSGVVSAVIIAFHGIAGAVSWCISHFYGLQASAYAVISALQELVPGGEDGSKALDKMVDAAIKSGEALVTAKEQFRSAKDQAANFANGVITASGAMDSFYNSVNRVHDRQYSNPGGAGAQGQANSDARNGTTPKTTTPTTVTGGGGTGAGKQTAANTKSAADSLARSKEDLKYLRDVATRKAINRFTTAKIDLKFTANNTIKGKQDVDGVNNSIWDTLVRATNAMAEA